MTRLFLIVMLLVSVLCVRSQDSERYLYVPVKKSEVKIDKKERIYIKKKKDDGNDFILALSRSLIDQDFGGMFLNRCYHKILIVGHDSVSCYKSPIASARLLNSVVEEHPIRNYGIHQNRVGTNILYKVYYETVSSDSKSLCIYRITFDTVRNRVIGIYFGD